jgi:hypothetical protein
MPVNVFTVLKDPAEVDTTPSGIRAGFGTATRLSVDTSFTEQQR